MFTNLRIPMKKLIIAFALLLMAATASSVFAQGATLQLQGPGGAFTTPVDATGNATITNVKPGTYHVFLLVPAVQKVRMAASSTNSPGQQPGQIDIQSWSWGATHVGSANGGVWKTTDGGATTGGTAREASAPSISEIVVTKNASPTHATHTKKVTVNGQEYYQIKLEDILISSDHTNGGGSAPAESLSLNFTKITYSIR
jgi:type VI protein secretion system component Hcp